MAAATRGERRGGVTRREVARGAVDVQRGGERAQRGVRAAADLEDHLSDGGALGERRKRRGEPKRDAGAAPHVGPQPADGRALRGRPAAPLLDLDRVAVPHPQQRRHPPRAVVRRVAQCKRRPRAAKELLAAVVGEARGMQRVSHEGERVGPRGRRAELGTVRREEAAGGVQRQRRAQQGDGRRVALERGVRKVTRGRCRARGAVVGAGWNVRRQRCVGRAGAQRRAARQRRAQGSEPRRVATGIKVVKAAKEGAEARRRHRTHRGGGRRVHGGQVVA